MKSIFYAFAIMITVLSCNSDPEGFDLSCEGAEDGKINIRIFNTSAYEIVDLNYDNIETFSLIPPGATSKYMPLESANDVPWSMSMVIKGEDIGWHLIDDLGLTALSPGCYSYALFAYEYDDNKIWTGGKVYPIDELIDLTAINTNCDEFEISDCNPQPDKVNIRLKNASAFDLCNVEMDMTNRDHTIFGNLNSGQTTCYLSYESARAFPLSCQFILGDEEVIIENPSYFDNLEDLPAGFYTYNIAITRPSKQGAIQLSFD